MGGFRMRSWWIASAVAVACGTAPVADVAHDRVTEGTWGGEHVALAIGALGAVVDLDCAHGEITVPFRLEADGTFRLPGYYVRDVGPTFEPEDRRPAIYFGSSDGRSLTLSFILPEEGVGDGPFTAFPGAAAQLQECR